MNILLLKIFTVSLSIIIGTYGYIELEVDSHDIFPYPANKSFSIVIVRKDRIGTLSDHIANTMIVLIRDNDTSNKILDRSIFDYGFKEAIDQPYKSDYMTIPSWFKDNRDEVITLNILFLRQANNKIIEVYQFPAQTSQQRKKMLQSFDGSQRLFHEQINLFIPPRIELSILSLDGRKNELMLRQNATATCRSFDGIPTMEPLFHGLDELDVKGINFVKDRNERKIHFLVSLFDHKKRLRCTAGKTEAIGVILVMHHPTQVTLDPEPGTYLQNGSTVACLKADGYPVPSVRWTFINGPANASRFYTIKDGGANFMLSKDAPIRSRWTLNCTAHNIIPGSTFNYHRTVTFIVGGAPESLFSTLSLMSQIILGAIVIVAIFLFCCIICIVRKCCASKSPSGTTRKNGIPNKAASKEKGLEAEQVILLPPGSPPNYVDLSNSGAGLPPPPPEYELMITDETKRPIQPEKRQQEVEGATLRYNEVTYAELNTSNLPMKNSSLQHTSSCNDDQVIYSQIVGTVSNAYGTQRSYTEPNNNV